jgi:hypothetical protein
MLLRPSKVGPLRYISETRLKTKTWLISFLVWSLGTAVSAAQSADGVFVRFRLNEPAGAKYYVKLGGYVHQPNWYLPAANIPADAEKENHARVTAGEFTGWFDLGKHAGASLHGRLNRAGGIAELPNVMVQFVTEPEDPRRSVEIELAIAPDTKHIAKQWHERFVGNATSFLVSPNLAEDAGQLETATEMTERRMQWAMAATGGVRHAPKDLLVQTSFWGPQRPELNTKEAKILWLLGFNVVGNVPAEDRAKFPVFRAPSASFDVLLGPESDHEAIRVSWDKLAPPLKEVLNTGSPYTFHDEICARPPIGDNNSAVGQFREWLKGQKIDASTLGAASVDEVVPIETPDALRLRMKANDAAARRVFYYTSRYRQHAATERLRWNTEEFHKRLGAGPITSTLVADHPYFSGTGLGMGMDQQNSAWGGWHLAADWFDIGRRRAVDMVGIEDWLGLQFMYGPQFTWEGFQLMGFQAAMFRSASRGEMPIMAWITPSDERNLRLKAASSLCQGAKHFFYWTYGPTATSTENYWSDQPGSYPGMAHLSRMLEFGEKYVAPGKPRATRVAILYSISSDLWQPFGYAHMLDRRGLYLALIHEHYLVDLLTEEDISAGRLGDYRILYTADPCISIHAAGVIRSWVKEGGTLIGTCAAGSRNEFGEPATALANVFGIAPVFKADCQPGEYRERGRLNDIPHRDRIKLSDNEIGVIGVRALVEPRGAVTKATFTSDGRPALLENQYGKGRAIYFTITPGISYIKDAKFVTNALAEKWPAEHRQVITHFASESKIAPLVRLSEPVVEAGIFDAPGGSALVLANFTYRPIALLNVELPVRTKVVAIKSLAKGTLDFKNASAAVPWREEGYSQAIRFALPLDIDDIIILETK